MSLALANLKPGTGKTTSAVWLAHVFARAGNRVLLVDADPSGSTLEWSDLAAMDPRVAPQQAFPFRVVALPSRELHRRLPGHPAEPLHHPGALGIRCPAGAAGPGLRRAARHGAAAGGVRPELRRADPGHRPRRVAPGGQRSPRPVPPAMLGAVITRPRHRPRPPGRPPGDRTGQNRWSGAGSNRRPSAFRCSGCPARVRFFGST